MNKGRDWDSACSDGGRAGRGGMAGDGPVRWRQRGVDGSIGVAGQAEPRIVLFERRARVPQPLDVWVGQGHLSRHTPQREHKTGAQGEGVRAATFLKWRLAVRRDTLAPGLRTVFFLRGPAIAHQTARHVASVFATPARRTVTFALANADVSARGRHGHGGADRVRGAPWAVPDLCGRVRRGRTAGVVSAGTRGACGPTTHHRPTAAADARRVPLRQYVARLLAGTRTRRGVPVRRHVTKAAPSPAGRSHACTGGYACVHAHTCKQAALWGFWPSWTGTRLHRSAIY
jgi:hypothetical protein